MNIYFTKFGNVVEEFLKLENDWKDNSVELIWDINEISKNHTVTAISEDNINSNVSYQNGNVRLFAKKKLKNRILAKAIGNLLFLLYALRLASKSRIHYWISTDLKCFLLLNLYCKVRNIELIPNFSHDSQVTFLNVIAIKLFSINNIVVPGPYLKQILIKRYIKSNIYSRIPRYPDAFFQDIPTQPLDCKLHVLYAARLSKRKGIIEFMDALTDIYRLVPDIGFTIIGDGEEMDTVRQRLKSLPDTDRVRVLGSIPNTAIGTYMRKADVLVFPSHSEGFAKTWIEAILSELPMILTPIESITSIITNNKNGIYIEFFNYQSIINSILFLYHNNDELIKMKNEMKKLKNIFFNIETDNFSKCIFKIVNNSHDK